MRILIVTETFYPSIDGVVTRLMEAVRYISRAGHEMAVIAPDLGEDNFEGTPIFGVPAYKLPLYRHRSWGLPSKRVHRFIDDFNPDVVHVANPLLIGISGVEAAKERNLPLVVSYHTNLEKYLSHYHLNWRLTRTAYWNLMRRLHNSADINLCTSKTMRQILNQQGIERLHVLRKGVDMRNLHPQFRSDTLRQRWCGMIEDELVLLYVGRLANEKNIESLIPLLDRAPDVRLIVVGDGPISSQLKSKFGHRNVIFTGYLTGDALSEVYATADAFVFPSTTETLGLVILEAMASGLPIIAAKSGPTKEQVRDGKTGVLYQEGDIEGLLDAVQILRDPDNRIAMSLAARHWAERFSWTVTSQQLLDYYHLARARRERLTRKRE